MPRASDTLRLIEGMTDEGAFERLSLAVLRRIRPDCEALIHEGANADGKPIPAPLDGFGLVPGSDPPHFVMVACTSTSRDALRKKWLFDHLNPESHRVRRDAGPKRRKPAGPADDGDLIKAVRAAIELRMRFPNATFKTYLVTNRSGVGDLITVTTSLSKNALIDSEIVDATRLADFLDFEPSGEWVRAYFFGTPILHVSADLLRDVSKNSLRQRGAREDFNTVGRLVTREAQQQLNQLLAAPSIGLIWLVAPPGKGKSVLTVQAATTYAADGGSVLWLSEQDVAGAETLDQAVETALRREHPDLQAGSGLRVLTISATSRRIVLLVDDLNRLANPEPAFRKVSSWIKQTVRIESVGEGASAGEFPCVIMCPIWPQHFDNLRRRLTADRLASWERGVNIPDLSDSELAALFAGGSLTVAEQQAAGIELGRDPLLCAVYADELRGHKGVSITPVGVLDRYLQRELVSVASSCGRPHSEYREALEHLGQAMLQRKNLRPTWADARNWCIENVAICDRLTELVTARKAIYLQSDTEVLLFTHDRLLTLICASRIPLLQDDHEVIEDPYFAEIIGRSVAAGPLVDDRIRSVLEKNPLAVCFALLCSDGEESQERIGALLKVWAQTHRSDDAVPEGLWWAMTLVLVKTDAPIVVDLAKTLPPNWNLYLAGLRNGSALAGIDYCIMAGRGWFLPGIGDQHRDSIIEHAVKHHAGSLATDLSRFLRRSDLNAAERAASLVLAGFFGFETLTSGILELWRNCPATARPDIIAEMIWALARCAADAGFEALLEVHAVWEGMPSPGPDLLDSIAVDFLGHCPPTWLPEAVARRLIEVMPCYPRIRPSIEHLISCCDTPAAFEFQVRKIGEVARKHGSSHYPFLYLTSSRWDRRSMGRHDISTPSRLHLRAIWSDSSEPTEDREVAFALWLLSAKAEDLATLQSIPAESPLYGSALRRRLQLQDNTARDAIADYLPGDWSLLHDLPAIWSSGLIGTVTETFAIHGARIFNSGRGSAFLLSIPLVDAETLLEALWPNFHGEKDLQTAALLLGSTKSRALVTECLTTPEICDAVLQRARFMMMTREPYLNHEEVLPHWLDQCTQYLPLASQNTLRGFAMICRSPKAWRWHEEHVAPYLQPESRTDLDERMDLANLERDFRTSPNLTYGAHDFFEQVDERGKDRHQTLQRITAEADSEPTLPNVTWLAACIAVAGNRQDLRLLDRYSTTLDDEVFRKLQTDCAFAVRRRTLE